MKSCRPVVKTTVDALDPIWMRINTMESRSEQCNFKPKTLEDLLKLNFDDSKTVVTSQANALINELLVEMVLEFAARAREQAAVEGAQSVSIKHLEKVLPQAMLDFN
ncbi:centromere protein X-like [Tropilaelaps mercedesae]|uniref:Centromere protein X n=1 Tax=Tropilaelaps mercedesae TaxID=418985 RepID=A0A1V9X638_9ACAR|nr:centromere protein X-like [Tropilaelaps mercedesae]